MSVLADLIGQKLDGRYRLVRPIATGGMGAVYEGRDVEQPGLRYAIKVLHTSHSAVARQRFYREAAIMSELAHEHIVAMHDFRVAGSGMPYMVMELLEGEDLAVRIRRLAPMVLSQVVDITQQIALGLGAAHRAGIVHRDLKPQNVFLCRAEQRMDFVKVLDFGVSMFRDTSRSITRDNTIVGTPNYMSPEQAEGVASDVDERTDVFALGAVLWEMLTGRRAFEAPTVSGTLYQVVRVDPPSLRRLRPDLPQKIEDVLRAALAKSRKARYPTVRMLAKALTVAAAGVDEQVDRIPRPTMLAVPSNPADTPTVDLRPLVQKRRQRILFVDDSPSMCALVSTWLASAGYEVSVAHDGEEGIARVRSTRPDLVIADVSMPRCDGFALCRQLKDDPSTRAIPVILFTRLDEATDIVNGLAAGADAFVVKGSRSNDLLRQVEHLLPGMIPNRRQSSVIEHLSGRLETLGRNAIVKRLFDACFREIPFDVLAVLIDRIDQRPLLLLGSHYELSDARAEALAARVVEGHANMGGNTMSVADLDQQVVVVDDTAMWGDEGVELKRAVIVPMLDNDRVIGCLGVFSADLYTDLETNTRFFFDIGVAAARALRRPPDG